MVSELIGTQLSQTDVTNTPAGPLRTNSGDISQSGADDALKKHEYQMPSGV